MAADHRPRMRLLIDENVPKSVAEYFASRGHSVQYVQDLFPAATPDPVIAQIGDKLSAIVVTWNRDFRKFVSRIPAGNRGTFRRLGRISFQCREPRGVPLLEHWIETVEFHYAQCLERRDFRMIVQIQESRFKAW